MVNSDMDSPLERELRALENVIGVVVLQRTETGAAEIQVFTDGGRPPDAVREQVDGVIRIYPEFHHHQVYVFELAEDGHPTSAAPELEPAAPEFPEAASQPARPLIGEVSVETVGDEGPEAHVSLILKGMQAEGIGKGRPNDHALRVIAATTLEAAQKFLGRSGVFALYGVSLAEVFDQEVMLVLVHIDPEASGGPGHLSVGAALVGDDDRIQDSTVKATLDAVNRHFTVALAHVRR